MWRFDPGDTVTADLRPDQMDIVQQALRAPGAFSIQHLPGEDKAVIMAEICYQYAKHDVKTLIVSHSGQMVDKVLNRVALKPKIRVWRKGIADSAPEKRMAFTADSVTGLWLNRIAALCRQDLLAAQEKHREAEQIHLELDRLAKRQTEMKQEYASVLDKISGYQKRWQELSALVAEVGQDCQALQDQQTALTGERVQILSQQQNDCPRLIAIAAKIERLTADKQETQAVIADNLTRKEELEAWLAQAAKLAALDQQSWQLEGAILAKQGRLQQLEPERQRLVKDLSLLAAYEPDDYVWLRGSREEQLLAVAEYHQYLSNLVNAAGRIISQEQAETAFVDQDFALLRERIQIIKERQSDLKSTEKAALDQLEKLAKVLTDTAEDYGWSADLLKLDNQPMTVTYHSINCLREETNNLLWASPPEFVVKLGFGAQWKRTLLDLAKRAKTMQQLVGTPGSLHQQSITEIEHILLECRHAAQRVYEASYRLLIACGQQLDKSAAQITDEMTACIKELEECKQAARALTAELDFADAAEANTWQQRLEETESALQAARSLLENQEALLTELQQQRQLLDTTEKQHYERYLVQMADITRQLGDTGNLLKVRTAVLAKSEQHLADVTHLLNLSQHKLDELAVEQEAASQKSQELSAQLETSLKGFDAVRVTLLTEWINRLQQDKTAGQDDLKPVYMANINVTGISCAAANAEDVLKDCSDCDVIITDICTPVANEKKVIMVV